MGWLFGGHPAKRTTLSGTVPEEPESVPEGYERPAEHPGTPEKLEYQTWESFSCADHSQKLTKTAVSALRIFSGSEIQRHVPQPRRLERRDGADGTPDSPHAFKRIVDHAVEDGKIKPLILVLPTYNNTSPSDSGSYSLALA